MVGLKKTLESKPQTALIKASQAELNLNNLRAIFMSVLRFLQRSHDKKLIRERASISGIIIHSGRESC